MRRRPVRDVSSGRLFIVLPPDKLGVDLAKTSAREKRQMGGFAMSHHGALRVGIAALAGASMLALTASMAAAQYKMTVNRDRLVNAGRQCRFVKYGSGSLYVGRYDGLRGRTALGRQEQTAGAERQSPAAWVKHDAPYW